MSEPLCGCDLHNILMVKHGRGEATAGIPIIAATDVDNPLCGDRGAARVFGRQKGATPAVIEQLDAQLRALVERTGARAHADHSGAGAAGGFGFGVLSFFGGTLANGFELMARSAGLSDRLIGVDLCITAEGRLDHQTQHGKAVVGVARLCRGHCVPCIALAGSIGEDVASLADEGLTAHFGICDGPMSLDEAMRDVRRLLTDAACNCVRLWAAAYEPQSPAAIMRSNDLEMRTRRRESAPCGLRRNQNQFNDGCAGG